MYDEAEKSFNRAIQINGNHVFCMYGLGKVYYELGNRRENGLEYFKKAKIYFDKAIKRDKSFPYAKFDLGRTLAKLESDRVRKLELDCMLQGMESDNSKAELKSQIEGYYSNLESYFEVIRKTYEEAMELFRQKYPCENDKYEHWKDNITFCIKNLENTMKHYEKLKDIGIGIANNEKDIEGVFKKVLFYTISTGVEERTVSNEKKFNTTFLSNKFPTQINDEDEFILHTLRRWNSFTPIIADNSKGGGYYIEYKGNGIVIDPGHNFIDNFKQAGFKFANINSILITHAHDDHTADLESIINLLYRYNKQLEESIIPREVARENWVAANNVNDILRDENNPRHYEYKEIVNERYSEQKKKIDIYMSEEAFIKYSGIFKYDKKCRILTTADEIKDAEVKEMIIEISQYKDKEENRNEKEEMYFVNVIHADKEREFGRIRIRAIKSSHRDLFEKESSLGFVFEFEKTALVYTGDTGWRDIEETYQNIKYKLGDKKIILLAHIGGFKLEEIEALDEAPNINCHYKNHLGRLGLVQINKILQPQICLISEFGEEFKYNRVKVAKIFNAAFKDSSKHTNFIPADIGLSVDLQKALIKAYIEIDTDNRKIIWDMVDPNEISVGEYKKGNSLFYYINNNKLTENECLQALMQDFKICRVEKK